MLLSTLNSWEWILIIQFFISSIAIIDIVQHQMDLKTKLLWLLVVLSGVIGVFIYWRIGRTGKHR